MWITKEQSKALDPQHVHNYLLNSDWVPSHVDKSGLQFYQGGICSKWGISGSFVWMRPNQGHYPQWHHHLQYILRQLCQEDMSYFSDRSYRNKTPQHFYERILAFSKLSSVVDS